MDKIFVDCITSQCNFPSPNLNRNQIIINKSRMYESPHELGNDLRFKILGNQKILQKSLKSLENPHYLVYNNLSMKEAKGCYVELLQYEQSNITEFYPRLTLCKLKCVITKQVRLKAFFEIIVLECKSPQNISSMIFKD